MPQLNLDPWALYFLLTWIILMFNLLPKILEHQDLDDPDLQVIILIIPLLLWVWPWH